MEGPTQLFNYQTMANFASTSTIQPPKTVPHDEDQDQQPSLELHGNGEGTNSTTVEDGTRTNFQETLERNQTGDGDDPTWLPPKDYDLDDDLDLDDDEDDLDLDDDDDEDDLDLGEDAQDDQDQHDDYGPDEQLTTTKKIEDKELQDKIKMVEDNMKSMREERIQTNTSHLNTILDMQKEIENLRDENAILKKLMEVDNKAKEDVELEIKNLKTKMGKQADKWKQEIANVKQENEILTQQLNKDKDKYIEKQRIRNEEFIEGLKKEICNLRSQITAMMNNSKTKQRSGSAEKEEIGTLKARSATVDEPSDSESPDENSSSDEDKSNKIFNYSNEKLKRDLKKCKDLTGEYLIVSLFRRVARFFDEAEVVLKSQNFKRMSDREFLKSAKIQEKSIKDLREMAERLVEKLSQSMKKDDLPHSVCKMGKRSIVEVDILDDLLKERKLKIFEQLESRGLSLDDKLSEKSKYLDQPQFTGDNINELNFYEFKEEIDNYIKVCDVSREDSSALLKKCLKDQAKIHVEKIHGKKIIPDKKTLLATLKHKFGNTNKLKKELVNKHLEYGKIPYSISNGKSVEALVSKHLILLDKAESLENEVLGCIEDDRSYKEEVEKIMPEHSYEYLKRDQESDTWLESIRRLLENLRTVSEFQSSNETKITRTESSDEESDEEQDEEEVREDSRQICHICKAFGNYGGKHKHSKNGYPEPDTCPNLIEECIDDKDHLLKENNICRKCCKRISGHHGPEETCQYLSGKEYLKCSKEGCGYRYSFCPSHQSENQSLLNRRQKVLKDCGLEIFY